MLRTPMRAALAALLLALTFAPTAAAHAEMKSATPGPGDKVVGSPTELIATFSQNLDPSRTSLEVRSADGSRVAKGGESGDGKREFRLALPDLAPGKYEVRWTSFSSEDGELARGNYTFTVVAAPSPTPTASPTPSASASTTASPTVAPTPSPAPTPAASPAPEPPAPTAAGDVLLPIVVALVFVAILGAWLLRRRRP